MRLSVIMVIALTMIGWGQRSHAETGCTPNEAFDSVEFAGEVYGNHPYEMESGLRRVKLAPIEAGWQIEIYRSDGSSVPIRPIAFGIPSSIAIQIIGQDFRNSDNTRSVQGTIIRKFSFGRDAVDPALNPELIVPHPRPGTPVNAATVEPTEGELGIGELIVEDIGLTDLGKGLTPRLTYLKFSGCLGWHRGYREPDWRLGSDTGVPDAAIFAMKQCGFDSKTYHLSDYTTRWGERGSRAFLEPDFMADGIHDITTPVTRHSDGKKGLAICLRSENRMQLFGFEENEGGKGHDISAFMTAADYWYTSRAPLKPGAEYPHPVGDTITIGTARGPSLILFMDDTETLLTRRQSGT